MFLVVWKLLQSSLAQVLHAFTEELFDKDISPRANLLFAEDLFEGWRKWLIAQLLNFLNDLVHLNSCCCIEVST